MSCVSPYGLMYSFLFIFFFKQKTAYEMRISDWSSDVCSSDLARAILDPELVMLIGSPQIEVDHQHLLADPAQRDGGRETAGGFALALLGAGEPQAARQAVRRHQPQRREIVRASCRDRVCQYVSFSGVAVPLNNKNMIPYNLKQIPYD